MEPSARILVLWNQTEEDIYERWREEGPKQLAWNPAKTVPDVGTVAEEMDHFIKALIEAGYHVDIVNVEDDIRRVIGAVELYRPDAIFNLIEFFNDEAIQETYIAGLIEILGVPFTGNRAVALATCQNKYRTKVILEAAGLPTAAFFMAQPGAPIPDAAADYELDFPLIVKPGLEDASGGIEASSVVQDQLALEARVRHVWKEYEMPALVEEYIEGREIHAAVLGDASVEVLPLFEMEFDDSQFNPDSEWRPQMITFRAKWDPHSKDFYSMDAVCPAIGVSEELELKIRQVVASAFKAVGCRDYARIDMRIDDEDNIYILEINPNPDLVDDTAYVMCAKAGGRSYPDILRDIVELALERGRKEGLVVEDAMRAGLPTDALLREWHMSKRGIVDEAPATPVVGGVGVLGPMLAAIGGAPMPVLPAAPQTAVPGPAVIPGDAVPEPLAPDVTGGFATTTAVVSFETAVEKRCPHCGEPLDAPVLPLPTNENTVSEPGAESGPTTGPF